VQAYFDGPIPPVDHMKSLRTTAWLSNSQRRFMNKGAFQMDPEDVIRVLNRAKVRFVLMGAHALHGWSRVERATQDVDVLVQKSQHRKAVAVIAEAFPNLLPEEHPVVTRFREAGEGKGTEKPPVRIDVMKASDKIHKAALKHTVRVQNSHDVPTLEMMLACKFAAMTSPNRERHRAMQDGVDFALVVQHNKDDINRIKLRNFGELVFAGGGAELVKLVDDMLAGRMLVF
jgi:hypothetical protein